MPCMFACMCECVYVLYMVSCSVRALVCVCVCVVWCVWFSVCVFFLNSRHERRGLSFDATHSNKFMFI